MKKELHTQLLPRAIAQRVAYELLLTERYEMFITLTCHLGRAVMSVATLLLRVYVTISQGCSPISFCKNNQQSTRDMIQFVFAKRLYV